MNRAMFSGVAGLKAHQTKMDVIGNNIANVNTYGYKAQHAVFSDVFYQTIASASAGTATSGGTNPSTVGYGSKLVAVRSDMGSSSLQSTGNSMDVAITGEGFFAVKQGNNIYYTKAGELGIDTAGNLVDVIGSLVCGESAFQQQTDTKSSLPDKYDDANKHTINILEGINMAAKGSYDSSNPEIKLSDIKGISIGTDGIISATYNGTSYNVGQIYLGNFANPSGLQSAGNGYYEKSNNSGDAIYSAPGSNDTGALQTSTLEMSNVDLASEFADMITTQRGFQANSRIISVSDTMLEELVNLKR